MSTPLLKLELTTVLLWAVMEWETRCNVLPRANVHVAPSPTRIATSDAKRGQTFEAKARRYKAEARFFGLEEHAHQLCQMVA